ncbi:MAG: helix-turn-helix domain-containing protein [Flavisolibacter sp.]
MKGREKKTGKKSQKIELDADEMLTKLGARIRQLRKERGFDNYEHFAYEHNISRAQYGRYEKGQDIRFSTLIKVVNAFGMTLDEFFSDGFENR